MKNIYFVNKCIGVFFQASSKDSFLHANEDAIGHQLPGGRVFMSPHHKWVASGGSDGQLHVRTLAALVLIFTISSHTQYWAVIIAHVPKYSFLALYLIIHHRCIFFLKFRSAVPYKKLVVYKYKISVINFI